MHALLLLAVPIGAEVVTVAPGEDWCAAANAASPGDEIALLPGDHAGPCTLAAAGSPGAPITVRAEDPSDSPRIVYEGASDNVINVQADWIAIRGLRLGPSQADIDGVKVKSGSHTTVEDCVFDGIGGIGVAANSADGTGIVIRGNTFRDTASTAIYLGCHSGSESCTASDVLVEGNLVDGVRSGDGIGYGLQIKRDSWGTVRDNVIHDTQGPGIEIFGSVDPTRSTVVDGNLVVRAIDNASIEVGGPHVIVSNNVVIGGGDGGIYVYAYWESVNNVVVAGNNVIGEDAPAFRVSSVITGSRLVGNAAHQPDGSSPFPVQMPGLTADGNVDCTDPSGCWEDAGAWDFRPLDGGHLPEAGLDDPAIPYDFCGVERGSPPAAGALERGDGPGPLTIALKTTFGCPDGTVDTGDGDAAGEGESGSCGCAAGPRAGGVAWLLLASLAVRRTGRRAPR